MADVELFSEELISEAKEIEKQDVVVDELQGKLVDLQSYLQNLTNAGVVCKNDAIALESIEQGILTSKTPINSFTTQHSKTNFALAVKQTQVSIESVALAVGAAIAAAIVMVVAWIIKLLTKSNSDSKDDVKKSDEFKKRKEEFDKSWKKTQDDIKRQYADAKLDSERVDKLFDDALSRIRDNGGQSKVHQTAGNHTIEGVCEVVEEDNAVALKKFIRERYSNLLRYTFKTRMESSHKTLKEISHQIPELTKALDDIIAGKTYSDVEYNKLQAAIILAVDPMLHSYAGHLSGDVYLQDIHVEVDLFEKALRKEMTDSVGPQDYTADKLIRYIEDNNARLKELNVTRLDDYVPILEKLQEKAEKFKSKQSASNQSEEEKHIQTLVLRAVNVGCRIYVKIIMMSVRMREHIKQFENELRALAKKEEHNAAKVVSIVRENVPKEDQPKSLDDITEQLKSGKFSF